MTIDFRQADWEVWWADTRNREVPPETVVNRILRMVNFVRKNKGLVLGITECSRDNRMGEVSTCHVDPS